MHFFTQLFARPADNCLEVTNEEMPVLITSPYQPAQASAPPLTTQPIAGLAFMQTATRPVASAYGIRERPDLCPPTPHLFRASPVSSDEMPPSTRTGLNKLMERNARRRNPLSSDASYYDPVHQSDLVTCTMVSFANAAGRVARARGIPFDTRVVANVLAAELRSRLISKCGDATERVGLKHLTWADVIAVIANAAKRGGVRLKFMASSHIDSYRRALAGLNDEVAFFESPVTRHAYAVMGGEFEKRPVRRGVKTIGRQFLNLYVSDSHNIDPSRLDVMDLEFPGTDRRARMLHHNGRIAKVGLFRFKPAADRVEDLLKAVMS